MVGILDNKNIAELVIKQDDNNYLKINPETLATVVENVTKSTDDISFSVQQHMDDESIHLTNIDVQQLTSNMLEVEDVIAGSNITIERVPDTNNIVISSADFKDNGYPLIDNIIPEDDTITITPNDTNDGFKIRANIPDVSKMVKQRNIKSGDTGINIIYDEDSNDVYLFGEGRQFKAGVGLEIVDETINNTAPDKTVTLTGGNNIQIDGEYPDFTISSSDVVKIADWSSETQYDIDDFVIYNNALFRCVESHTSLTAFESDKWKLVAGWSLNRQSYTISSNDTFDIVLPNTIPNKDVLLINVNGVLKQSTEYDLQPDNQTIRFKEALSENTVVEIIIMSNIVLDTYNTDANITFWQSNTAYANGSIILYEGTIYICLENHVSTSEFDKSKWQLICGYYKNTYDFIYDSNITEITLPVYIASKQLVEVNVDNSIMLSSKYNIDDTGYKIIFNESILANTPIEVNVYNSGYIQLPELPSATNKPNNFVISDENGESYTLKSKDEVLKLLSLDSLADFNNKSNSVITVNPQGDGFNYVNFNQLSGILKAGQLIDGLSISLNEDNLLKIEKGSIIDNDQSLLLTLPTYILKDISKPWKEGFNQGCVIGSTLIDWQQPTMQSNLSENYQVFTSDYITDREGWRALDGLKENSNGWLVNDTTATFKLFCKNKIKLYGFDFYNTMSGTINHSKDIDVWVGDESHVVKSFTAQDKDYGYTHIEFDNDVSSNIVGFTIKNSYGQACGASEIKFLAKEETYLAQNICYYVYLISNENGSIVDVAISTFDENEFSNNVPDNFPRFALIGTFNTDNAYNIVNQFPITNFKRDWINGSLIGSINNNIISSRIYDEQLKKPVVLLEQFGESATENGRVNFSQPFSKLLYVVANGEKIISKDNSGFTVNSDIENVSWFAKGYK